MTDYTFVIRYTVDGGKPKTKELSGVDQAFVEKRLRDSYPKGAVDIEAIGLKGQSLTELLDKTFPQEKIMPEQKKVSSKKVQAAVTAKAKPEKSSKKTAKPAPKPEKKVAAKPAPKLKNVHYPIADLSKVEFIPKWVYANL